MKKSTSVIYKNVKLGKNPTIEDYVVLGKPPRGSKAGQLKLVIGDFALLRTGTVVYAGNIIGDYFQTGDYARIRESNKIGNNASIGGGSVVEGNCKIEDNVRVHSNCFIPEYTSIEKNAWIGPGVVMINVLHPPCPAFKKMAPLKGRCCCGPNIKKNAVIGARAVIFPGVIIGEESVVGAGAVVTKNVPAKRVVTGSSAKVVKKVKDLTCPLGLYTKGRVYSWRKR